MVCNQCNGTGKVRAQQGHFTVEKTCQQCRGLGDWDGKNTPLPPPVRPVNRPQNWVQHPKLQCRLHSIDIERYGKIVNLRIADGECVDMNGAIHLAVAASPEVEIIQTWAHKIRDTTYVKRPDGWHAY